MQLQKIQIAFPTILHQACETNFHGKGTKHPQWMIRILLTGVYAEVWRIDPKYSRHGWDNSNIFVACSNKHTSFRLSATLQSLGGHGSQTLFHHTRATSRSQNSVNVEVDTEEFQIHNESQYIITYILYNNDEWLQILHYIYIWLYMYGYRHNWYTMIQRPISRLEESLRECVVVWVSE